MKPIKLAEQLLFYLYDNKIKSAANLVEISKQFGVDDDATTESAIEILVKKNVVQLIKLESDIPFALATNEASSVVISLKSRGLLKKIFYPNPLLSQSDLAFKHYSASIITNLILFATLLMAIVALLKDCAKDNIHRNTSTPEIKTSSEMIIIDTTKSTIISPDSTLLSQ